MSRQENPLELRLVDLPGYADWSRERLEDGISAELLLRFQATMAWVRPEEYGVLSMEDFDDMFDDYLLQLEGARERG